LCQTDEDRRTDKQPDPGVRLYSTAADSKMEEEKKKGRKGGRERRRERCLPPSPACQSVTEGENDRPQWGPSTPS